MSNYLVMELRYREFGEQAPAHRRGFEGIPGQQ